MSRLRTYKPLQAHKRLNPISPKKVSRVGKLGIERKRGDDMGELRRQKFAESGGFCQMRDDKGQHLPGCQIRTSFSGGELVHVQTKRNHGDTLENTIWGCRNCHSLSHNCDGHPCPRAEWRKSLRTRIHLAISSTPLRELEDTEALCGKIIERAHHQLPFNDQPVGTGAKLQLEGIVGLCKACKQQADGYTIAGKVIVYGLIAERDYQKSREAHDVTAE